MIRLLQRRLIIPRGDSGSFSIPTIGSVGENDIAIFGIFDPLTHKTILMKKINATKDVLTITLDSQDTINISPKKYNWDITIFKNPIYDEDNELIGAAEVNSYYSAFKLPVCEITEVVLNMNKDRWNTSALLLNTNDYQVSNNIQTVYPWEKLQRTQLEQQLYNIAVDNGYSESFSSFIKKYNLLFSQGEIFNGTLNDFPIPGNEKNLYFDNQTNILYYYKQFTNTISNALLELPEIRVVETIENDVTIYHLYAPIKALEII